MINTSTYPPTPLNFILITKKQQQGFCKRHCRHMPSILFACSGLTFERVFEPWGGVNEEELGLVLCYHLVILLDGLSEHVLRKLVLGVRHKQLQGHTQTKVTQKQPYSNTETTSKSHTNNFKVRHTTLWSHTHNFKVTHNLMVTHKQLQSHTETTSKSPRDNLKVVNVHMGMLRSVLTCITDSCLSVQTLAIANEDWC